jgi:hypothetical protein
MADAVPLIYTSKGNLPIDSLSYQTRWELTDEYIKFVERYLDATGEVVRESAHVYSKQPVTGYGQAASIGG